MSSFPETLVTFGDVGAAEPLDSNWGQSYMADIPFHRLTGGAFVRAPFFHWSGSNALRWDGRVPAVLWS